MEKKNFFAPLSKGLGATRRAAMLLLVMLLTTATAWAWSGSGTSENPYKISSAADLARIRTMMNSGSETFEDRYFVQTADIDCSDMAVWNDNQGAGIGRDASHAFKGRYDGGGYEIRNLLITATNSQYAGLFGYIVGGQYQGSVANTHIAEVHGVVLVNPTITITATSSEQYVGAIVGYAGDCSQIYDNTVIGGTVTYTGGSNYNTNSSHVGGIVGRYGSSNLPRLTGNTVVGTSLSGAGISGGLVGYLTIYYGFYDNFADASISSADFGTAGLKREGALVGSYHHVTSSFTGVNYYHSASGLTAYGGNYTYYGSSYSFSPVADDEWAAPLYTVSAPDGLTISGTPTVTYGGTDYYASGTTVTLSSIVPTGQHLTTYKANDINLPGNTYTMGSSDVSFSRVLEYNTYSVHFEGNGSTSGEMADQVFTYDVAQNLTPNGFSRAFTVTFNYNGATGGNGQASAIATATFNGWAETASGAKVYNDGQSVNNLTTTDGGTVNLYAKWTDGSVTLPTPVKTGYTFAGWYSDAGLTAKVGNAGDSYTPSADIPLYAKWNTTYNITYNLNGGSVATPNHDTFNVESETFQLNNPTKPGYTFIGWTGSNGNTPQMEVTITKGSTEDRTYNANYEFARITVGSLTYECTSGTEAKVIACNNSATSVTIPTTVSNNDGTYSVTAIEATAFSGCTSLLAVILASETPQTLGSGALDGCTALNAISVPAGSVETYKDAAGWSNYADKIQGYEGKCGDNVYYAYDRITKTLRIFGTGTIDGTPWSRYCMDITTVIIGNGVTSIDGFGVFNNCTSLTSVVIPASVTSIGFQAFLDCHLTSIAIPASVTSIGDGAFYGCSSLETISVADGNTVYDSRGNCNAIIEKATNKLLYGCKNTVIPDNVTSIDRDAFYGCSGLTSIEIPASVTSIGDGAFYGCTGLETISVADGNTVYDSRNNCNAIIEKKTNTLIQGCKTTIIPASVTSIYNDAFKGCTGLTDVTIPASVTSIGERAFFLCAGLESVIIYAPSLEYYGSYAFDNNASGRKIYVPSSSVDAYKAGWSQYAGNIVGFDACGTNVYYVYDSSTKTLRIFGTGNMADYDDTNMPWYSYCENIAKVVIEGGVTSIDTNAFKGCSSLNTVVMKDVTPLTLAAGAFDNCTALHAIYVPAAAVETYKDATGWSDYAAKIQGYDGFCGDDVYYSFDSSTKALRIFGTGNMANYIFSDYRPWNSYIYNIQTVVIEDGVTSIDRDAFSGCSGLTSIEIPASVTSIGNGAFYGCSSLETISVADGNTVYDSRGNCNAIIEKATNKLLYGCKNTVIPDNVTSIDYVAFRDCTGLESITIPASVTSIYDDAFRGCTGLASVTIYAPSLDFYGSYAFYDNAAGRKIYVFSDCVDTYKAGWSQYADDILPIEHLDVAANAHDGNYWTTFYCGHSGYKIDEGENAWAYTAEYDGGNAQLTLHKLGKVIPKGTAVILVGADNSISMTASNEDAQYSVANNLHGVDIRTATSELGTGTFYVMGKQSGNFGFFPYTAQYMPARKAYLLVDGGTAQARGLTMTFDETTGISSTTNYTNYTNDNAWYTLDGRKLDGKPTTKGLYINNGRKIVIK